MEEQETSGAAGRPAGRPPSRKAYEKPTLQIYGDLTEITQSMKFFGMDDGGSHPNRHYTR
jgi:hypothetical protein